MMERLARLALVVVLFVPAIVAHEYAHAWAADKLGDPTPRWSGRLTLNPRAHFDLSGALLFLTTLLFFGIAIGWAKPVPINPLNFPSPVRDMALVALAGPLSNLAQAAGCYIILVGLNSLYVANPSLPIWNTLLPFLVTLLGGSVMVNLVLAFFNLIPAPPLDGSRILRVFLPYEAAMALERIGPFGVIAAFFLFWVVVRHIIGGLVGFLFGPLEVAEFIRIW